MHILHCKCWYCYIKKEWWISFSRYLAQNAAIWLADEVWRYRDHDTLQCQDDISRHLITQQSKGRNVFNGSRIVARNGESTHIMNVLIL